MASVEVTISGVLFDKIARTTQPVVLIGEASLTGVGVGGGPIYPPEKPPGGPPGQPTFPIWGPPGSNFPDKPGYPPVAGHPLPIPPIPTEPPSNPNEPKPPPPDGGWGWHPEYGWGYFPMTGGKPQPPG